MIEPLCVELADRDVVARYVAGTSTDAETEAFERHLIGCVECQTAVRLGGAIRLGARPAQPVAQRGPRWAAGLVTLAAAAAVVLVAGMSLVRTAELRALGVLEMPPAYAGVPVRSDVARADSLFGEGMRLYAAREFRSAARALSDARAAGSDSIPTSFFLGAIALLEGRGAVATRELGIVLRRGDSPYRAEAHFYLAKAWLRLARGDSAAVHLDSARTLGGGPLAAEAAALEARLEATR
jgi:hypothetical protein